MNGEVFVEGGQESVDVGLRRPHAESRQLLFLRVAEDSELLIEFRFVSILIALQYDLFKCSLKFVADLEDSRFDQGQQADFGCLITGLLFLGSAPLQLLPFWFANILNELLFEVVLVLDVGVGSCVGEVALPALALEVPAFGVFSFSPRVFALLVHKKYMTPQWLPFTG